MPARFSIIIPARDEAPRIGGCIDSVRRSLAHASAQGEIIVVANRCTDNTAAVACAHGARVVEDESKCLSAIRNTGARAASGDIIVTIDADSVMAENMLLLVDRAIASGRYVGGGVWVEPERWSLGIFCSCLLIWAHILLTRRYAGAFWCLRDDFNAIGGFDERLLIAEDLDLARRLRSHGRATGRTYTCLWRTHIVTSCRKFDRFGDWFALRLLVAHPCTALRALRGGERELADRLFYEFKH